MDNTEKVAAFWEAFLRETKRDKTLRYMDCYHFDNSEKWANELLRLVLEGTKKATASSLYFFGGKNPPVPKPGDLNIITDWGGTPRCVVETTAVTILPFKDMTFDICKREGEDDSLQSWQEGHVRFFTEEGKAEGYTFTWDMPVVFEDFKVVYKV